MGNGTSQSAELQKTVSLIEPRYRRDIHRVNKYASPQHKVLPAPVAGQKLKHTDNGNILSNGGTISGRKLAKYHNVVDETDPEVLAILNRRSTMIGEEEFMSDDKRFHSDPDIANRSGNSIMMKKVNSSPSKTRINKVKRKNKAPHPPESRINSLPMELDNKHIYKRNDGYRRSREGQLVEHNANRTKSPAPRPPALYTDKNGEFHNRSTSAERSTEVTPPPAPPLPTNFQISPYANSYERNRQNVSKLNDLNKTKDHSKEGGDAKLSTENKFGPGRAFNDKSRPSFHEDIKAALQQRLSSEGKVKRSEETPKKTSNTSITPLKQYYFSGPSADDKVRDVLKSSDIKKPEDEMPVPKPPQQYYFGASSADVNTACSETVQAKHKGKATENRGQKPDKDMITKAIVERTFSASENAQVETKRIEYYKNRDESPEVGGGRRSRVSQTSKDTPTWFNSEIPPSRGRPTSSGYRRTRSLSSSSSEGEVGIRMDLRPILPAKKAQEIPRFSPTEAWRSLSVDSIIRNPSNEVSSDETDNIEGMIGNSYRAHALTRRSTNKSGDSGIFPETDSSDPVNERYHKYSPSDEGARQSKGSKSKSNRESSCGRRDNNKPQWTPQQDLSDECESPVFGKSNSRRSQNPVMVRVQPKLVTSTAFSSLPFMGYSQSHQMEPYTSLVEDALLSPSEKVREKSRRTARRKSKASNKSVDSNVPQSNGLHNLKKSVKAALSMNKKQDIDPLDHMNWSLSRSIPGSLNEIDFESSSMERRGRDPVRRGYIASFQNRPELLLFDDNYRSLPQLNRLEKTGLRQGHVMYLPEYQTVEVPSTWRSKEDLAKQDDAVAMQEQRQRKRKEEERRKQWFLSEVEKEMVEKNNDKQPEWMNRVEEEFRLKRDREKVNIRQQLRILNLERNKYSRSIDGDVVNSSDSQGSASPQPEYRHRSRSEDGLSSSPDFGVPRRQFRTCSYHELREDISGPISLPTIPPPPKNPLPPLDLFLVKKPMQNDSSSPTSSSQASYPNCKNAQSKGFSRWFRKSPAKASDGVRPDPEGCRSSGDECKNNDETNFKGRKKEVLAPNDGVKRSSVYKQLNEIAAREEKLIEQRHNSQDVQNTPSRIGDKMNSAGESHSESDVEIRDDVGGTSKFSKSSVTSSEDGNVESGFYSSSDRRKPASELFKRYAEYGGFEQRKVSAAYAQPFTPSKGYRPVLFNPTMKSADKIRYVLR